MSFAVRLLTDLVQVEPGATVSVSVEVANRSEMRDRYEIEVQGLDPEWAAMPEPVFDIDAHETHNERFFLKPSRSSESLAGTYPFVVRVRSLETGESKTAQGVLEVKPFNHVAIDIQPRKGVVPAISRQATFQVAAMNLGNSEHTLQLYAADPDNTYAFAFDTDRVPLAPGQQKTVSVTASTSRRSLLANPRLQVFSVTGRSIDHPSVSASVQGQVEQRALVSPGTFLIVLFFMLILGAWFACAPQPLAVNSVVPDKTQLIVGDSLQVSWHSNADSVTVTVGKQVKSSQPGTGSLSFKMTEPGEFTIKVLPKRGQVIGKEFVLADNPITVMPPETVLDPQIIAFDIKPKELTVGQPFIVSYKLSPSVTRATLQPVGKELDVKGEGVEQTAQIVGPMEYKIVAYNKDGKSVEKKIKVNVLERCDAKIVKFSVTPPVVDPTDGRIIIEWQLSTAARAELKIGGETFQIDAESGRREYTIAENTTIKLVAYDANGKTVEKDIVATVRAATPDTGTPPAPETNRKGP